MLRRHMFAAAALAAVVGSSSAQAAVGPPTPVQVRASEDLLKAEIESWRLDGQTRHDLSPDGKWLAYAVAKADVETNQVTVELRLRPLSGGGAERVIARSDAFGLAAWMTPRFSPDSTQVAFVDPASPRQVTIVSVDGASRRAVTPVGEGLPDGSILDVRWSGDSARLAALVHRPYKGEPLKTGVSVSVEWSARVGLEPSGGTDLVVLDARDGRVTARTPQGFLVAQADWSPVGDIIAVSGYQAPGVGQEGASDGQRLERVSLFDARTGELKPVGRAWSSAPHFSPDGQRLAFSTAIDGDVYKPSQVGIYDVAAGHVRSIGEGWSGFLDDVRWLDNRTLVTNGLQRFGCALRVIDVDAETIRWLSTPGLECDRSVAVAVRAGDIVFARHSFEHMGDLWSTPSRKWAPRQLTQLNPELNRRLAGASELKVLEWPSADGRFTVPGLFIRPSATKGPLPTVVSITGGPSPVNAWTMGESYAQYFTQPTLARGYAVFLPVTRGRGAYGREFGDAMRRDQDYSEGPLSDLMGGVALLERTGLADPERLTLVGFSYGASLSAFAIGHTDKFRAAVLGDPGDQDYLNLSRRRVVSYSAHVERSLTGVPTPYTPEGAARLESFSALPYLNRVKTPTMLQCGSTSEGSQQGCPLLFQGLRYFHVPSEMVIFPRTGHGVFEPALLFDAEQRRLAWLDRWLWADRSVARDGSRATEPVH